VDNGDRAIPSPPRPSAGAAANPMQHAGALYARGRWAEAEPLCRSLLEREPAHPGALSLLGVILAQTGRAPEAEELLGRAAAATPDSAGAHTNHGNALRALGRHSDALACYERAIALEPESAQAHFNRGLVLSELRQSAAALASFERAVGLKPDYAAAWINRGTELHKLGSYEAALASADRAIALQPKLALAHGNRGIALRMLGRSEEALASFEHVLALKPNDAEALVLRGATLRALERHEQALASFERALELQPNDAEAHTHRGDTLHGLKRFEEAVASYDLAIGLRPNHAEVHAHRGNTLIAIGRYEEAIASCDSALAIDPRCLDAHVYRGVSLHHLGRLHDSLGSLGQAIRLGRRDAYTHYCRGAALQELNAFEEAIASYEQALAADPRTPFLRGNCRYARMQVCDWGGFESDSAAITAALEQGEAAATPFVALALLDSPTLQRRAAEIWVREKLPRNLLSSVPLHPLHDRIRVAYVSRDFFMHATSSLIPELFELHDRAVFEIYGVSFGPDDGSALRRRVLGAFDAWFEGADRSDGEIAAWLREREIDIAVDLKGYTALCRPGIFARRPAPVQVSYLGYPGTMAAPFIDYLIADRRLIPEGAEGLYTEKIVYLPDSYQVNDRRRRIAEHPPGRAEAGLPEQGFVFCCFNNSWKITPPVFDVWMRLLTKVPDSVFWLLEDNPRAARNLRRAAAERGVRPERLIFAPRVEIEMHLARQRLADLFLDTLPCNAHTTASDALWAGLPVLTCAGRSFAARVGASLLSAVGLPELVTSSLEEYEALAAELARAPGRLAELRARVGSHREALPLFDTPRFCRHLEAAYRRIWRNHVEGKPPATLTVEAQAG
jgi:protein O-GlcNAc transferase